MFIQKVKTSNFRLSLPENGGDYFDWSGLRNIHCGTPAALRNQGYECAFPVSIGDNVWIGGQVVINPGISIGENSVIGSESVVTKDIPDNVAAADNPCKVLRKLTDDDKQYYFK